MQTLVAPLSVNVIFQFTVQNQNCTVEYNNKIIQSDVSVNSQLCGFEIGTCFQNNFFFLFSETEHYSTFQQKSYSKCGA